jgi:hypothetical protein
MNVPSVRDREQRHERLAHEAREREPREQDDDAPPKTTSSGETPPSRSAAPFCARRSRLGRSALGRAAGLLAAAIER